MARVTGDRQIIRNLGFMGDVMTARGMDGIMQESLEPLADDTRTRARMLRNYVGKYPGFPQPKSPRKGGHLDEGVVTALRRHESSRYRRVWWVSFRRRAIKLAHLLEFGTRSHWQPRFRGGWMHPGAQRKPFFRPAFEANKHSVVTGFGKKVWDRIAAAAIAAGRR